MLLDCGGWCGQRVVISHPGIHPVLDFLERQEAVVELGVEFVEVDVLADEDNLLAAVPDQRIPLLFDRRSPLLAEAVDYGQRGYELGRDVHRGDPTLWAGVQLGLGLAGLGRHEEAIRHLAELVSFGHQLGTLPIPTGIATNCLAGVLREVGDVAAARGHNHEAIELVAPSGFQLVTVEAKVDLIFADLDEGEFGRAQRAWPAVWEEALGMPGVHRWRNLGRLEAARAMLSLATEQREQAADEARAAIAGARRVGRVKYEIACRVVLGRALVELGYPPDAVDQLRQAASAAQVLGHPQSQWQAQAALTVALAATGDDNGAAAQAARLQAGISRFGTTLSEERRKAFHAARWIRELAALTA